jgi:hypothetical protein
MFNVRKTKIIWIKNFVLFTSVFGSGSALHPHSMGFWIRIRIANPDREGGKSTQKIRKIKSEDKK